ncbi:MAG: OmpA family protein [Spirochaetales bacterium]|nr:MAG: OmpA family protein [Spirochaetales bacterium]
MEKRLLLLLVGVVIILSPLYAQRASDVENSKDYPLLSRFKGSVIEFYKDTKWGKYLLPVSAEGAIDWAKPMALEGRVVRIQYTVSPDNNSEFVLHNYKSAFKKAGFEVLIAIANEELGVSDRPHTWNDKYYVSGGYYNGLNNGKFGMGMGFPTWNNKHCFIVARGNDSGQDIYAVIYAIVDTNYTIITQDIIEVESVETGLVSAESISDDISAKGHIAIYDIHFDGDKATIKPESAKAIENIAKFLKSNTGKKYFIVGHAAGVGDFDQGMRLSVDRAKAVLSELVTKHGVDENQLKAYGVGALCPLASNRTDEGIAKNRRVEIVEQ